MINDRLKSLVLAVCFVALSGCGREEKPPVSARENAAESPLRSEGGSETSEGTGSTKLPLYQLRMEPRHLAGLEGTAYSDETHPGTFFAEGQTYERVRVRYRGAFARSWPKKPLKIFFEKEKPFQGSVRLNLNSGWRDPALVREAVAYQVYAACGAPAPRSRMVQLEVNRKFRGVYVEVEQPDKAFVDRLNLKGAAVYKAFSRSNRADERDLGTEATYQQHYEKETRKTEGYGELQAFCRELASAANTLEFFSQRVDLDKYVNYLVATTLTQNWDAYNKNHFLVFDRAGSGKWFVVPWDLDRTLGDHWDGSFDEATLPILLGTRALPGVTGWNRLQDRFFSEPTLRARFLNRLAQMLEGFTPARLDPILDQLESAIGPAATGDRRRWGGPSDFHGGIAEVKAFIKQRRAYLLKEVARLRRQAG